MTSQQSTILLDAIKQRKNILVSGSPASGKTTLTNALLDALSKIISPGHRVLILEQTPELQCHVKNVKSLVVSETVSMKNLLWISMRNSPDRIVVGEVRDGAALELLKAWNTGCPGGLATVHANHPRAAVQRILDLACEVTPIPPYTLAAESLDVIVQIEAQAMHPARRKVTEIVELNGFSFETKQFQFKRLDVKEKIHEDVIHLSKKAV